MMERLKKYLIVFCTMALLLPSIVSLVHIKAHQDEVGCSDLSTTHFHKKSIDCELCDFRISKLISFSANTFSLFIPGEPSTLFYDSYQYLSYFQKLSFELRGPPTVRIAKA